METIIKTIYTSILNGQKDAAISGMQAAVNAGLSPVDILKEAIVDAMTDASHLFESGKYFAPEMLITARAMQAAMGILKPYLTEADVEAVGPEKIFIGKEIAVLFEGDNKGDIWRGYTSNYIRVSAESVLPLKNQIKIVRITSAENSQAKGILV